MPERGFRDTISPLVAPLWQGEIHSIAVRRMWRVYKSYLKVMEVLSFDSSTYPPSITLYTLNHFSKPNYLIPYDLMYVHCRPYLTYLSL